jgi:hypothetical protein
MYTEFVRHLQKELAAGRDRNIALSPHKATQGTFCRNEDGRHTYSGNIGAIKNSRCWDRNTQILFSV